MQKTQRENAGVAITEGRTLDHAAKLYDIVNPIVTFGQEKRYSKKNPPSSPLGNMSFCKTGVPK
jgi:hypothetical protein